MFAYKRGDKVMNETQEVMIDPMEVFDICMELEQITSIVKATKFAIQTSYTQGLDQEEIDNIMSGLVRLLIPTQDKLYKISEKVSTYGLTSISIKQKDDPHVQ